ncbi:MAG: glycine cleavage system aminomethyltransferase GcvT [Acholeplasmataceae bacterium]|nr:glycine cleavage system aminomethyltransferase GcvT [Acholeplasmataceae bacterium]
MKYTALYEKHLSLNAKMIEYAGFQMPLQYKGISEEHLAVRHQFGIFDVSHMGEFLIEGKEALTFVNYLITNTIIENFEKVTYSLMCDEHGFVVDDLLVYPINTEKVLLVVNAGNTEKDFDWVEKQTKNFDVKAINASIEYSQIAIQGPLSIEKIKNIIDEDVTDLKFMTYRFVKIQGEDIIVSRTGYTGEDGFEVYGPHHILTQIWDKTIEAGAQPCGLGARDTLRFEANLPLYGHEISETINPIEAGLGFAVKLDKEFIGKDALVSYKQDPKRKIVGLELLERNIPRADYEVYHHDQVIGHVTTGYLLPEVETPLALVLIDKTYSELGTLLHVKIRNKLVLGRVRNRKFYDKNYKK